MSEVSVSNVEKAGPEAVVFEWWKGLVGKRGDRAELRRAHTLNDVIFTTAFQRLWLNLRGTGWNNADRVALVARVLSHADVHDSRHKFAEQLAAPHLGDKPRYSGLRFRRLLQYRDIETLFEPMVRALRLVGNQANIFDLANSLYRWNDETRRRWAFEYYGRNPKAE